MVLGIAGGIMTAGLIIGGFSGSIWILLICVAAGLLIAGAGEAATQYKQQVSANRGLSQYPPYGY